MATGSGLAFVGDVLAQVNEGATAESFDKRRTLVFTGIGVWWSGGFNHFWYNLLAARFPGTGIGALASKTLLTAGLGGSVYIPSVYLWTGTLYHGYSVRGAIDRLEDDYWETCTRMWAIWTPCNFMMFKVIPLKFQVPFISVVSLAWNVLLSLLCNGPGHEVDQCPVPSDVGLAPSDRAG